MSNQTWIWIAFSIFVLAMLTLDLGLFHRKTYEVKIKEALAWSAVWIGLALLFNLAIFFWRGEVAALEFLTGYLLEKSLSVDNVLVFLLIFSYFRVPALYQHKVLFRGILGALITRAVFVAAGIRGSVSHNYFLCFLPSSYSSLGQAGGPNCGKIGTTSGHGRVDRWDAPRQPGFGGSAGFRIS